MHNNSRSTILLVDDDPQVLKMLVEIFRDDYDLLQAASGNEAIEQIRQNQSAAAIIMDIKMTDLDGIAAAREIKKIQPDIPVIFHTGYPGDYDEAEIDSCDKPFDFILKGEGVSRLIRSVGNAVDAHKLKLDQNRQTNFAESHYGLIGQSQAMQEVYNFIRKVAKSGSKAMILGETGTGKELVARAIHNSSSRGNRRLAILSCHLKSQELVQSELFGHIKGSFTGATDERPGLFEYADGGSVFLDEIGDLDLSTQAKLLRVLETGEYQKIGEEGLRKTDVRILCATHRNLDDMVREGGFRQDLYFRLRGVILTIPPLRERREDIPLLISKFCDRFTIESGSSPKIFEPEALDVMVNYSWPGNVRQLMETVESLIVLTESDFISRGDVERYLNIEPVRTVSSDESLSTQVRHFERNLIIRTLHQTGNNLSATARLLKIDRTNLKNKLKRYRIYPAKIGHAE